MSELLIVVGARPNFMKAASVVTAARAQGLSCTLLHTGRHYDAELRSLSNPMRRSALEFSEQPPSLIQAAVGSAVGRGGRRTNRSGVRA